MAIERGNKLEIHNCVKYQWTLEIVKALKATETMALELLPPEVFAHSPPKFFFLAF